MWNDILKDTSAFIVNELKLDALFQQDSGNLCGTIIASYLVKQQMVKYYHLPEQMTNSNRNHTIRLMHASTKK